MLIKYTIDGTLPQIPIQAHIIQLKEKRYLTPQKIKNACNENNQCSRECTGIGTQARRHTDINMRWCRHVHTHAEHGK